MYQYVHNNLSKMIRCQWRSLEFLIVVKRGAIWELKLCQLQHPRQQFYMECGEFHRFRLRNIPRNCYGNSSLGACLISEAHGRLFYTRTTTCKTLRRRPAATTLSRVNKQSTHFGYLSPGKRSFIPSRQLRLFSFGLNSNWLSSLRRFDRCLAYYLLDTAIARNTFSVPVLNNWPPIIPMLMSDELMMLCRLACQVRLLGLCEIYPVCDYAENVECFTLLDIVLKQ